MRVTWQEGHCRLYRLRVVLVAFTLAACTNPRPESLAGEYIAEYAFGTERLTLLANGMYRQELVVVKPRGDTTAAPAAREVIVQHERWSYDPGDGKDLGAVVLIKCLSFFDSVGGSLQEDFRSPSNGWCHWALERRWVIAGPVCINSTGDSELLCPTSSQ